MEDPVTIAVNCWVWAPLRDTLVGVRDTLIGGARAMLAPADIVGSATLVALTVTICELAIEAGAV